MTSVYHNLMCVSRYDYKTKQSYSDEWKFPYFKVNAIYEISFEWYNYARFYDDFQSHDKTRVFLRARLRDV